MELKLQLCTVDQSEFMALVTNLLRYESIRLERQETKFRSFLMLKSRLASQIVPWFNDIQLQNINYRMLDAFIEHLKSNNLSTTTIAQYINVVRKLLKHALVRGYIDTLPSFPTVKTDSTPRGGFTLREYKKLVRTANQLSKSLFPGLEEVSANYKCVAGGIYTHTPYVHQDMSNLIRFMVNTFVRPVDVKIIRHEHVQIVRGQHTYLRLILPETKKHRMQIISMPTAVHLYEKLLENQKAKGLGKPDDYLFLPEIRDREAAIYLISRDFRKILNFTGLRYGTRGQGRSLYSLRHTAITFRLLFGQGIDLLTLARNARTSVEMIERFYASELSAEMNVSMLHSRRTQVSFRNK